MQELGPQRFDHVIVRIRKIDDIVIVSGDELSDLLQLVIVAGLQVAGLEQFLHVRLNPLIEPTRARMFGFPGRRRPDVDEPRRTAVTVMNYGDSAGLHPWTETR